MSETGDTSASQADTDTDTASDTTPSGNPDLHGAAKDVEEKRASGDPETTGA